MVLKELDEILRQRDYSHKALNDMQQRNIDWLAAPLFKAMRVNLCLSDLCKEYDMHRYDTLQAGNPNSQSGQIMANSWHDGTGR